MFLGLIHLEYYLEKKLSSKEWNVVGSTGIHYTVTLNEDGLRCNCIGFSNHEKCYHSSYIKSCIDKNIKPSKIIRKKIKIF